MARYEEALSAKPRPGAKAPAGLSHIEITHHMTDGSAQLERIEPGKMPEHMADCPHCGGE